MKRIEIPLPVLHPTQQTANDGAHRFTLFCCGRRWGKDVLLERRAVRRVDTVQSQGWFAPSYRMMTENYKTMHNRLAPIVTRHSQTEHVLELNNGAVIDFWSLDNYDAARGRKYGYVTINEAATSAYLSDAWNYVIRPTLADVKGGADFGTTPKGLNAFYNLWAQVPDNSDWARFRFTTYDNPYIPRDEIEAMRLALPERVFKQEILAEFVEDGAFFQNVERSATIANPSCSAEHSGHTIVAGVDWALSGDFTVITVGCKDCNQVVDWARFTQVDYTYQREFMVDIATRWSISNVLPERNNIGEPNIEILIQRGLRIGSGPDGKPGFNTTATTKPELIMGLASALEHEGFLVPVDYKDELLAYEVEMSMGGHAKFSAPVGQHDDRVISLALCWYAMSHIPWLMSEGEEGGE